MWKSKTGKPLLDHEISFWMFKGNYIELKNKASIPAQLMHIKMDMVGEGEDLKIDAVRSFYNFLMSAATLVDHYRVLVQRDSFNPEFKIEYDDKLSQSFHDDILSMCIKKLRNFTTHKCLPGCVVKSASFGSDYRLFLEVEDLKDWDKWNEKEKEFLTALPEIIDVINLLDPYYFKAEAFYRWFMVRYCHYYPNEKEDLKLLFERDNFQTAYTPPVSK